MITVTSPLGILALVCGAATQSQYAGAGAGYNGGAGGRAGAGGGFGGDGGNGGSLEETIPGIPGEDYPIYSEVPETSFFCDGQVDGGYYGDPEAECQAFHICASDGNGGLTKYSFLCPNGTLFNQQYFVCDWWFNVDCSTTEDFYSLNDEIAAEREANSPPGTVGGGTGQYQGASRGAGGRRGGSSGGSTGGSSTGYSGSASSPRGSFSQSGSGSGDFDSLSSEYGSPIGGSGVSAGGSYGAPAYSPVSAVRRRTSRNGRRRNSRELDLEETREVLEELVEDVE